MLAVTCARLEEFFRPAYGGDMALYDNYFRYSWNFGTELDALDDLETEEP